MPPALLALTIAFSLLLNPAAFAVDEAAFRAQIIDKTISMEHLKKGFTFKRYFAGDGTLVEQRNDLGIRRGTWKIRRGKLCFNLGGQAGKCRPLWIRNNTFGTANKSGKRLMVRFNHYAAGNQIAPKPTKHKSYTGPLTDIHAHIKGGITLNEIAKLMAANGVASTLIMRRDQPRFDIGKATPINEQQLRTEQASVKADIRLGLSMQTKQWRQQDPRLIDEAKQALQTGRYQLVGEISLRGSRAGNSEISPSSPLLEQLMALADANHLPVLLHHFNQNDAQEQAFYSVLNTHKKTPIIWAHMCGGSSPQTIRALFKQYPMLYCDLAWLHRPERATDVVDDDYALLAPWQQLIEAYPERFLLGIDLTPPLAYRFNYGLAVKRLRKALGSLSPATAQQVAVGNFYRLLSKKD